MNPNGKVTRLIDGRIDWSQSMQRDPCNGKLVYFDRYVDYEMKNLKGPLQYLFDSNRILT